MKPAPDDGFAMIEAIASLAIVSMCLAIFCLAIGGAYRAVGRSKYHMAAVTTARSQIDAASSDAAILEGTRTGTSGSGVQWRLTVTAGSQRRTDPANRTRVFWIVCEAFDRRGRPLVRLQTYRLSTALTAEGASQ